MLLHFILYTNGYHIFYRRMCRVVYRCSMLTIISLRTLSEVVCGSQMPMPFVVPAFGNHKAKILAMIIFIFSNIIEYHSTIHLLHIFIILCEITCQCQQINIVKHWVAKRHGQQASCRRSVYAYSISRYVKATSCEIFIIDQFEVGYDNATSACLFIILKFLLTHIYRIISMAKFDKPMSLFVRKYSLWSASTTITTIVQKQSGVCVLLFSQYLKGFFLQEFEVL